MNPTARASLAILAAACLFSTGGVAIKACTVSGPAVAGLRSLIAGCVVAALLPRARQHWTLPIVLVGLAYATTMISFVLANKLTTAASTIYLQSSAPIYMLAIGPLLLGESTRRRDLVVMAAIAVGILLHFVGAPAASATATDPALGNLLALLSGVAWAFTVAGLRWLRGLEAQGQGSAHGAVLVGNLLTAAACLPFALPVSIGVQDGWLLLYLGVFQIGAAYVLLNFGLVWVTALRASLLLLVEPALAPVWAWILLGEMPGSWPIVGGVIIVGATATSAAMPAKNSLKESV